MKEIASGLGIIIGIIVLVALGKNWNKIFPASTSISNSSTLGNAMTCTLRSATGNLITISGNSNDPQFVNMCQNSYPNQPYYIYGYPYYFITRRRHGGNHGNGDNGGNGNGNGNGGEM